jgi:hypothetical protein
MQWSTFEDFVSAKSGKSMIVISLVAFAGLTILTILKIGLVPIFTTQLQTLGGIQIYVDLVIMCLLFSVWMKHDAKKQNRLFIPWFLLTLAAGAIGPLLYLATRRK